MSAPTQPDRPANPMLAGLGPAAWAERADVPDLTLHGEPRIVPMRAAPDFWIEPRDPDPRGMTVVGADGVVAGEVRDLWVDRSEPQLRYLEVQVGGVAHTVLVPAALMRVRARERVVEVRAILARHFADVPRTAHPDRITRLEEDRVMAYFAGGHLYATDARRGPVL